MWPQGSSRGHRGQKFIFTKNVSSPLYYTWLSCHSYTWSSLTFAFKIINMNLTWGHLRSLRSKNGVKFWTILNGKTNTAIALVGVKHQKVSMVTSSPDLWLRGQRSKKVKSQSTWNDKSNTVNVLILVKHQKKSTVTSSSDLRKRGQRSKKVKNGVKFWTILICKTNTAKVLVGVQYQKVSTMTSSPDLWLRCQRSKKVKSQTTWNDKSNTVNVLILVKHKQSPQWPLHPTHGKEVKGQKRSNLKQLQVTRVAPSMYLSLPNIKKCTRWPLRLTNGWGCWHWAYMKSVCNNPFIWATAKGSKM